MIDRLNLPSHWVVYCALKKSFKTVETKKLEGVTDDVMTALAKYRWRKKMDKTSSQAFYGMSRRERAML